MDRGRTVAAAAPAIVVLLWSWLRLERSPRAGDAILAAALALAAALVAGRWWRALAVALATVLVLPLLVFDVRPDRHFRFAGEISDALDRGAAGFQDVTLPFGSAHGAMHSLVVLAVFGFSLFVALAVAARRPGLALVALLVGAGWPATLLRGDELLRGAGILVAALAILAALGGTRGVARPLAVGGVLVFASLVLASSSSVARGGLLDWQTWSLGGKAQPSVSVAYVWRSNYDGLRWPRHETTVLEVTGSPRSVYWRAATLDVFADGIWVERPSSLAGPLADPLLPTRGRDPGNLIFERFEVKGLRDTHLPAPGSPVEFRYHGPVTFSDGGVAHVEPLERGERYDVSSYAPAPTPRQLASTGTHYPDAALRYLELDERALPSFGTRGRAERVSSALGDLAPLYARAAAVTRGTESPYAAALALESWLRSSGGFTYEELPPRSPRGRALVDFVLRTKAGYCQHFAGAMALMLRTLGVPARVAVGFTSGTYDVTTHRWTVSDRDAHAWVEAWFPRWGWIPFDPTPGRGTLDGVYSSASPDFDLPGATAALRGAGLASSFARKARANPLIIGERPTSQGGGAIVHDARRRIDVLALLLVVAVGAAGALAAAKHGLRRLAYRRADGPRARAEAARRELAAYAADQGVELPRSATLAELVPLLRERLGVDASAFAAAAGEAAYAPPARAEAAAQRVPAELRSLLRAIRADLPLGRRLRGAVSLRSL